MERAERLPARVEPAYIHNAHVSEVLRAVPRSNTLLSQLLSKAAKDKGRERS